MSQDEHIVPYRVRPRFEVESEMTVEEIADKIKAALKEDNARCKGNIYPGYARVFLPAEEQHYWSPMLTLTLEESENGSVLRGLFGPRPTVWAMFVFFYAVIGFALMVILIIGLSHWTLGMSTAILWWVPVLLAAFLSLYLVAYSGQKLGKEQMHILHQFIEKSTGLEI